VDGFRLVGSIRRRPDFSLGRLLRNGVFLVSSWGFCGAIIPMMTDRVPHSPVAWTFVFALLGAVQGIALERWDIPLLQFGLIATGMFPVGVLLLVFI